LCNNKIWIIDNAIIIIGNKKCNIKNLFKVGSLTEKPPQIQSTKCEPIDGIDPSKFVITVAPQRLIFPQGRT
jgi:hypothetical protein